MRKINLPDSKTALEDLKTALTYKNGDAKYTLTDEELKIINDLYKNYDILKGVANKDFKSINLKLETNNAIYNAYSEVQEKNRLEDLRSRILLSINRCPFCGISVPDELDHHLPRSIYKAVSVYSSNLIPLCHKCNNKKRTVTGENIEQRFTHVYFDDFPDSPLLIADVTFKNGSLSCKFKINQKGISNLRYKQLNFQIERIDLNKRLRREWNDYLTSFAVSLEIVYGDSNFKAVQSLFLKQSETNKKDFGINDWRTALTYSLSNCLEFCNGGFKGYYKNLNSLK